MKHIELLKNHIIKSVIILGLIFLAMGIYLNWNKIFPGRYVFVLDGKELSESELVACDNQWHYENLTFIPCIFNNFPVVIYNDTFDYSLSPNENCNKWNATFPGFHKNQTLSKEKYDSLMPVCYTISTNQINKQFLNNFDCIKFKSRKCVEWSRENLIIRKKWI